MTTTDALSRLPEGASRLLSSLGSRRSFDAGESIVRRGAPGTDLIMLTSGSATETGEDYEVRLSAGALCGVLPLLTELPQAVDVVAATECSCMVVPYDSLRSLLETHPDVASFLTIVLGENLVRHEGIRHVGPYDIINPLGEGGFSRVFSAVHRETGEPVAMKMLEHSLVYDADLAKRFRREAAAVERMVHPGIVRIHELVDAYATIFLAMELIHGTNLGEVLRIRGRLTFPEVRFVLRDIADALHHAHEQDVIHRDVKPQNILIDESGTLKLVDFGIALTEVNATRESVESGTFNGTVEYASPEHISGDPMDRRSDVYMLGILAFELTTGQLPFVADARNSVAMKQIFHDTPDPRAFVDVPADLCELIEVATRKVPEERYDSCQDVVELLSRSGDVADGLDDIPRR